MSLLAGKCKNGTQRISRHRRRRVSAGNLPPVLTRHHHENKEGVQVSIECWLLAGSLTAWHCESREKSMNNSVQQAQHTADIR